MPIIAMNMSLPFSTPRRNMHGRFTANNISAKQAITMTPAISSPAAGTPFTAAVTYNEAMDSAPVTSRQM